MKAFRLVAARIPLAPLSRPILIKRGLSSSTSSSPTSFSSQKEGNHQAEILSSHAKQYALQGHYASMVDNLQEAIKLDPTNRGYHSELANGLIRMKRIAEAGQILQRRAQMADEEHATGLFESGKRMGREGGDLKSALQCLDVALQFQPGNSTFLKERSNLHFKSNSFADGMKDYVDAVAVTFMNH